MKLDIKGLLVLALIAGTLAFFWLTPGDGLQAAPKLQATTIDGKQIDTGQLKGKPYLVVFWATDCPGCIQEIPHLNELYSDLGKDGFEVIGIAMPHDELPLIQTMRKEKSMKYDIVFDEDGMLAKAYGGVRLTPTSFLVSPKGKITLHKLGMFEKDEMRQMIEGMLKG